MKFLILIFSIFAISCGQSPADKDKDKGVAATYILPTVNSLRPKSTTPDSDTIAAMTLAQKIETAKTLPTLDVSTLTTTEIQALDLNGVITNVNMTTGIPVVTFYITTNATTSRPASRLVGFGWTTKTDGAYSSTTGVRSTPGATSVVTNLTAVSNMQFNFSKLVAGTNGAPDKWISYTTTTIPTPEGTIGPNGTAFRRTTPGWQKNSVDTNGTIVDNGDGSYTYTFARDITKSKDYIVSEYVGSTTETLTALSAGRIAGMGDMTYNASLPHRVAIGVGLGTVRGTGANNPDGTNQPVMSGGCTSKTSCSGTAVAGLNFTNGTTLVYDFIPGNNQVKATQRDIVKVDTCNRCHQDANATTTSGITTRGLIFHGAGGRNDVTQCVMCHNDQTRAQTDKNLISVNGVYDGTNAQSNGLVLDGYAVVDFPIMVHKFHMSSHLVKSGTGYYAGAVNYMFPTKGAAFFTKADAKLCYNCHTTNKSANHEDNWKTKPSRIACGSCHDGIDFATGLMTKSVKTGNTDITHGGGKQTDDSQCASCHTVSDVIKKHGL